jgi:putative membrane protein
VTRRNGRARGGGARPLAAAAVGAVAGILGAWMMVRFQHLIGGSSDEEEAQQQRRRDAATPNEIDGTVPDEPATVKAATRASEALTGRPLDEREKEIGGSLMHYGFGAAVGALYGVASEMRPDTTALAGLPFGAAVWLAADELGVPLAGLAGKPTDYPLSRHLSALGSHLVFGLTLEGVRRSVLGPPPRQ